MAMVLKCKMCGGDIEVNADMTVGTCLFCGSTMTLPKIENDKKARLFNRANDYRLNNDCDKAYDAYKTIAEEDEQEAEAYWGMILSEYGVEYVEDPKTGKRIPTCHRTQVQSILDNTNYKLALRYSSGEQKLIYKEEAEALEKLQRQIIAVSSRVEPYDVFISYKETDDETGERTRDSVLAQSIFDELEKQGIHTFFSRVSLEEHLGENYEPYIYAALKSARVMLMVSCKGEYCDAVWVKNEWSRFLRFMEEDDNKVMIPVYQDMNAYEFPNALSKYQAQDMGKIGALQDMVRGIKKILGTTQTEKRDAVLSALLEDKKNREEKQRKKQSIIKKTVIAVLAICVLGGLVFGGVKLYQNVLRPNAQYKDAEECRANGKYDEAIKIFEELGGYKDSNDQVLETTYLKAVNLLGKGEYDLAITVFEKLNEYKDSMEQIVKANELKATRMIEEGKYDEVTNLLERLSDDKRREFTYKIANHLAEEKKYDEAVTTFKEIYSYEDSADRVAELLQKIKKISWEDPQIGDIVAFGSYDLDKINTNGTEWIEWIYMKEVDGKAFLISKYSLFEKPIHPYGQPTSWDNSEIRRYLNGLFFINAFSDEEKKAVVTSEVLADKNPKNSLVQNGLDTRDKLFLLSLNEAKAWFKNDSDRICTDANGQVCRWWLRTNGLSNNQAAYVNEEGELVYDGAKLKNDLAVRPAMWVDLSAITFE